MPCENEKFQFSFPEFEEELFSMSCFVVYVGYEKGKMNIKWDLRENKWVWFKDTAKSLYIMMGGEWPSSILVILLYKTTSSNMIINCTLITNKPWDNKGLDVENLFLKK